MKGKVIFAMIGGSFCYNLNLKNSDFDFLGVYVGDSCQVLGLPESRPIPVVTSTDPDIAVYEISKFCECLATSSPVIFQMIFTERYCYETEEWKILKKERMKFITTQTIKAYLGHTKSEIKGVGGPDYSKNLYHAFRLLFETQRMLNGEGPRIYYEGEQREFLLNVREKKLSKNEYLHQVQELMEKCEKEKTSHLIDSIKKDTEPYKILENWLIQIRLKEIQELKKNLFL